MIGLGRMGLGMTSACCRAGHQVVVYDRSADAVKGVAQKAPCPATAWKTWAAG